MVCIKTVLHSTEYSCFILLAVEKYQYTVITFFLYIYLSICILKAPFHYSAVAHTEPLNVIITTHHTILQLIHFPHSHTPYLVLPVSLQSPIVPTFTHTPCSPLPVYLQPSPVPIGTNIKVKSTIGNSKVSMKLFLL